MGLCNVIKGETNRIPLEPLESGENFKYQKGCSKGSLLITQVLRGPGEGQSHIAFLSMCKIYANV